MTLSLPIPVRTTRDIELYVHPMPAPDRPVELLRCKVTVPIRGSFLDLKMAVEKLCGIPTSRMCVRETLYSKFVLLTHLIALLSPQQVFPA